MIEDEKLLAIILALGAVIRYLMRNENLASGASSVLLAAVLLVGHSYVVDRIEAGNAIVLN